MKDIELNVSYPEGIARLILAVNVVGFICYYQAQLLIGVPFYLLVTTLTGFCPAKCVLYRWLHRL